MNYLIRFARIEDAAALSRLSIETFNDTFRHYTPQALEQHLAEYYNEGVWRKDLSDAALQCYVAEAGGQLIAYMKTGPYKLPLAVPESPVMELHRLYVHKNYHGKGIGRMMMEQALRLFQDAGAKAVLLGVWENNMRAQEFYKHYGFAVVGDYSYPPIGKQIDRELIMKKVF